MGLDAVVDGSRRRAARVLAGPRSRGAPLHARYGAVILGQPVPVQTFRLWLDGLTGLFAAT